MDKLLIAFLLIATATARRFPKDVERDDEVELKNTGENCWPECDKTDGLCDWCGTKGGCCRKNWVANGCDGTMGGRRGHRCVRMPEVYVDDGCQSERKRNKKNPTDDMIGSYWLTTLRAGVRCCLEDATEGLTCTTETDCTEEEGHVTYAEATATCARADPPRRICTKDELLTDICCKTGGGCDNHAVWTSTLKSDNPV